MHKLAAIRSTSLPAPATGWRVGLSTAVAVLVVAGAACVDLTRPWDKLGPPDGGRDTVPRPTTGGASGASDSGSGGGGHGGSSSRQDAAGGQTGALDGPAPGGAGGTAKVDGPDQDLDSGADAPTDRASEAVAEVATDGPDVPPTTDAPVDVVDVPLDQPAADVADAAVEQVSTSGLLLYYPCEGPGSPATQVLDLSGNGNHGGIAVGPAPTSIDGGGGGGGAVFSYGPGKVGAGLSLDRATFTYVALPAGLLAGQQEMTVALWIKVTDATPFQRIFDFGTDTTNFVYLAVAGSSGVPRFRIISAGAADGGVSQAFEGTTAIAAGAWTHVALVLGAGGASLYMNGVLQASSPAITLRPADLGAIPNHFIGRSEFPKDPYFDGAIDELRIYRRALAAPEIAGLAGG